MKVQLLANRTIGDLQKAFNDAFPYLKLVFFKHAHDAYKGSPARDMLSEPEKLLSRVEAKPHEGVLYIEPEMPVWQVERLFKEEYGLYVQVFRKSGNLWLETSITDDLTLEQQNAKGRAAEHIQWNEEEPPGDYREQE
jgi:hypothetical protein